MSNPRLPNLPRIPTPQELAAQELRRQQARLPNYSAAVPRVPSADQIARQELRRRGLVMPNQLPSAQQIAEHALQQQAAPAPRRLPTPQERAEQHMRRHGIPVGPGPVPLPPSPVRFPDGRPLPVPEIAQIARSDQPSNTNWVLWGVVAFLAVTLLACGLLALGAVLVYAGGILPGVYAGGVALGGSSQAEAARELRDAWTTITVRDGSRLWRVDPATLGITLDADSTARAAYAQGRTTLETALPAIFSRLDVPPTVTVDPAALSAGLDAAVTLFDLPAVNAGVTLIDGQVQPTPPQNGRALQTAATVARVMADPGAALRNGTLDLVMADVQPAVLDATSLVEAGRALLAAPLTFRLFDPVTGNSVDWSVPPEQWSPWLTTAPNPNSPAGVGFTLLYTPVASYLSSQAAAALDATRSLDLGEAVAAAQTAVGSLQNTVTVQVHHNPRQHVVQPGQTLISIAWDYGIPYLYIAQANGGLTSVSAGQTITIPPADAFLKLPVVPNKRIVVSISQQRAWVYENGALKWDWLVSTGIPDSPTWPGIYQVLYHEPNAYAGNWNLWMPYFLGVYQPIPGSEFTNGFHGFPSRGGSQILWANSLGRRVTYGCILLSTENAKALYDWAEDGVVVEIRA
jgi:lipoprotein-anchoring transpeptidase ErfK/SrfK